MGSLQGMRLRVRLAVLFPTHHHASRGSHLHSLTRPTNLGGFLPMKRRAVAVTTSMVIAAFWQLAAQQQPSPLAAAYPIRVGDMVAQTLSELLKIRTDFKDAAVVTYEPTTQTIDLEVFASPRMGSKTDQARALLGQYW